jgi:xanthine dehydrogenase YagR molybdenum-binding subunit
MAPYIGTGTSRIDGVAKVTGAAKYAAEFNASGLLHGSIVTSTIAKGRIKRIDASAAKRVKGVIEVLTHANRPQMADNDKAYKDDVAPLGSPFRPLYDNRIMFNGQPIALVVAETSEVARFAASLVRVEYEKEAHVTTRPSPSNLRQMRSRLCSRHRRLAGRRSGRSPLRQCAMRPNTTRRSSITTQWSSMHRP